MASPDGDKAAFRLARALATARGAHLARHGCNVEVRNEDSIGRPVAKALLDVSASFDADLIVMGGYRNSRLQQAFLPGVTRTLLHETRVPLLLSH
ncbi:MAG: hypothetical protein VR74_16680 [Hyphomonas sp. BRH_c22]|uniref:universal stress protein n=1 Tax=Hyphomonas sp. BRH_c22 TaxID=1629710 RepID=UPI0005F21BC8|nr:universal stress protein [Hyphomonas sp. BRH_c22]KJS35359.1 MAG: hypothetical protein VR74_16680 [Hyphomonas sp. BRH_c22]